MPWLNVVLLFYGILDVVMGFVGYAGLTTGKHSVMSLIGGATCGAVILASVALSKAKPRESRIAALVVTILMMGMFAKGTFVDNKLYPAGIMFVASLAVAICLGMGHMMGMKAKRAKDAAAPNSGS